MNPKLYNLVQFFHMAVILYQCMYIYAFIAYWSHQESAYKECSNTLLTHSTTLGSTTRSCFWHFQFQYTVNSSLSSHQRYVQFLSNYGHYGLQYFLFFNYLNWQIRIKQKCIFLHTFLIFFLVKCYNIIDNTDF